MTWPSLNPYASPQRWAVKTFTGLGTLSVQTAALPPKVPERPGWLLLSGPWASTVRPGTSIDLNGVQSVVLWVQRSISVEGQPVVVARLGTPTAFRSRRIVQAALAQGRVHAKKQARPALRRRMARLQRRMQESMRQLYVQVGQRAAETQVDTDDWEDSTVCVCCLTNVYPKKLGPLGYCGACLMDIAEGAEDEYDPEWGRCGYCGKYAPLELDSYSECKACQQRRAEEDRAFYAESDRSGE